MNLGLDLVQRKSLDDDPALRTGRLATSAALTDALIRLYDLLHRPLPLVLEQGDRLIGTSVHTVGAPVALLFDDLRNVGAQFQAVLAEDGCRPGRRRLRLENGFVNPFRGMGQAA